MKTILAMMDRHPVRRRLLNHGLNFLSCHVSNSLQPNPGRHGRRLPESVERFHGAKRSGLGRGRVKCRARPACETRHAPAFIAAFQPLLSFNVGNVPCQ